MSCRAPNAATDFTLEIPFRNSSAVGEHRHAGNVAAGDLQIKRGPAKGAPLFVRPILLRELVLGQPLHLAEQQERDDQRVQGQRLDEGESDNHRDE